MHWNIPGTTLTLPQEEAAHMEDRFRAMFMAGGIVLSQVASITGLEPYTVQNWVKRGFLSNPVNKKYSLEQLCRILNINMLKAAIPMEKICSMLAYVNGQLDDDSDDLISDATLYFLFVKVAAHHRSMQNPAGRDSYLQEVLADYVEPVPGARERVEKVLTIMLTAWAASQLRQAAEKMVEEL